MFSIRNIAAASFSGSSLSWSSTFSNSLRLSPAYRSASFLLSLHDDSRMADSSSRIHGASRTLGVSRIRADSRTADSRTHGASRTQADSGLASRIRASRTLVSRTRDSRTQVDSGLVSRQLRNQRITLFSSTSSSRTLISSRGL